MGRKKADLMIKTRKLERQLQGNFTKELYDLYAEMRSLAEADERVFRHWRKEADETIRERKQVLNFYRQCAAWKSQAPSPEYNPLESDERVKTNREAAIEGISEVVPTY
jgi:hypothetical protein